MLMLLHSTSPLAGTRKAVPETSGTRAKTCFLSRFKHSSSHLSTRKHVWAVSLTTQDQVSPEVISSTVRHLKNAKKIPQKKLLDAYQLFIETTNKGQRPAPSLARTLIYNLGARRFLRKAVQVVEIMFRDNTLLDQATCSYIIEELAKEGAYDYAIQLLDEMQRKGCTLDPALFNTLTMSLCEKAYGGSVWHHLKKLIEKEFVPADRFALQALIDAAYLQRGSDAAVYVLYQFMLRGVQPNMACYNNVLTAFKKESRAREAFELLSVLPPDMKHNLVTYNILLNLLGDQGQWREAEAILDSMMENKIMPNIVTYKILILVIANKGYADEALEIAEKLAQNGFRTDEWCFNPIIAQFCLEHRLDMVHKCLESMERWNCLLYEGTCKAITVLCKEGMVDEAFDILESLREKQGLALGSFYGKVVLPYLCRKGSTIEALQLLTKLAKVGYTPCSQTLSYFVIGMCMEGMHEEALNLFEGTNEYNVQPDSANYRVLVSRLCKGCRTDLAIIALERMVAKGYTPPQSVYLDLLQGIGRQGRKDLVAELLRELNARGNLNQENTERIIMTLCLDDVEF